MDSGKGRGVRDAHFGTPLLCPVQVSQVRSALKKEWRSIWFKDRAEGSSLGSATHLWVTMTLRPQLPPLLNKEVVQ